MNHSKQDNQVTQFISLVPMHLRKYVKQGIFIIPTSFLIDDYFQKKEQYLEMISANKQQSVNSMHKYTAVNPVSTEDINQINLRLQSPLNKYYSLYLKQYEFKNKSPELFASFAIHYNKGHRGLSLHVDDSTYTVNFCLQNSAQGNQVVFNQMTIVDPLEDYALIHSGKLPHHTNELTEGERTNVILWFK